MAKEKRDGGDHGEHRRAPQRRPVEKPPDPPQRHRVDKRFWVPIQLGRIGADGSHCHERKRQRHQSRCPARQAIGQPQAHCLNHDGYRDLTHHALAAEPLAEDRQPPRERGAAIEEVEVRAIAAQKRLRNPDGIAVVRPQSVIRREVAEHNQGRHTHGRCKRTARRWQGHASPEPPDEPHQCGHRKGEQRPGDVLRNPRVPDQGNGVEHRCVVSGRRGADPSLPIKSRRVLHSRMIDEATDVTPRDVEQYVCPRPLAEILRVGQQELVLDLLALCRRDLWRPAHVHVGGRCRQDLSGTKPQEQKDRRSEKEPLGEVSHRSRHGRSIDYVRQRRAASRQGTRANSTSTRHESCDAPWRRSAKVMGTSVMRQPADVASHTISTRKA